MSELWESRDLVVSGRFAPNVLRQSLLTELGTLVSSVPYGFLTFSRRYCLRSLTAIAHPGGTELPPGLIDELGATLRDNEDRFALVDTVVSRWITDATTLPLTDPPRRLGDLGVAMILPRGGFELDADVHGIGRSIAEACLGSILAASHREGGMERVLRGSARDAGKDEALVERPSATPDFLRTLRQSVAHRQRAHLLTTVAEELGEGSLIVFHAVESGLRMTGRSGDAVVPEAIDLEPDAGATPAQWVADLDAQYFSDLSRLVQSAYLTDARLLGVTDDNQAVAAPFGALPTLPHRPTGVLLAVRPRRSAGRPFSSPDLDLLRILGTALARSAADQRWFGSVEQIAARVQQAVEVTSTLPPTGRENPEGLTGTSGLLANRRDIAKIAPLVRDILRDLTGPAGVAADAVTVRLVVSQGTQIGVRWLARLASAGGELALASPPELRVSGPSTASVNSWVAWHGLPCYLRDIPSDADEREQMVSRWATDYPGLEGVELFRTGIRSELCIPLYAEGRLVGTVNLESTLPCAFDDSAHGVEEYGQLIGLSIMLARRDISVQMLEEAGGFLDRRHILLGNIETALSQIAKLKHDSPADEALTDIEVELNEAGSLLSRTRTPRSGVSAMSGITLRDLLEDELHTIGRTKGMSLRLSDVLIDEDALTTHSALTLPLALEPAKALSFALRQVVANAAEHGLRDGQDGYQRSTGWRSDIAITVAETCLGGVLNGVVAVSNGCFIGVGSEFVPGQVFREPIEKDGRYSLGAFLAGEELRRVGGAASFRHSHTLNDDTVVVVSELTIPVSRPPVRTTTVQSSDSELLG